VYFSSGYLRLREYKSTFGQSDLSCHQQQPNANGQLAGTERAVRSAEMRLLNQRWTHKPSSFIYWWWVDKLCKDINLGIRSKPAIRNSITTLLVQLGSKFNALKFDLMHAKTPKCDETNLDIQN
jgi:hypothetical protein